MTSGTKTPRTKVGSRTVAWKKTRPAGKPNGTKAHPWGKRAVMANGEEVVTGTEEHRRIVEMRHAAGTPPKPDVPLYDVDGLLAAAAAAGVDVEAFRRPPKPSTRAFYNEFHAVNARKLVALGLGDYEVAEFFGISVRTMFLWMKDHPEFREAMRLRSEDGVYVDDRVKRSLLNRATGYSFQSEKVFHSAEVGVVRVPTVEHVPPDPGSAMFWLKNRQPDDWSDRRDVRVDARVAAITPGTSQADALALFRAVLEGSVIDLPASEYVEQPAPPSA